MDSCQIMKIRDRLVYILKHNTWLQIFVNKTASILLRIVGLFVKTDSRLVLINSFAGKKFNDSPRVLFETMCNDSRFCNFKYVWAFENPEQFNIAGAKKIKIDTWKYFIIALKAKIWISSVNIERGLCFKNKDTIYINTWHGAGTKKIGNACSKRKDYNLSNVNIMLTQSEFENQIFIRDFKCRPSSLRKIGFPRNDELFHITNEDRDKYRKLFDIPKGKRVILYAPTWRDSKDGGLSYRVEPPINIHKWHKCFSEKYVLLFRMHPFTTIFNMQFDDFARDISSYDNLNHILSITDVLITDYSTIIYDSAIANVPFICFGFDYEHYYNERGFYYDLNKIYPGGVLHTEDEVISRVLEVMNGKDSDNFQKFKEIFIEAGGNSSKQILDELYYMLYSKY